MKLFDYKFLILLALTLVVYFIFREVLDLRKKVNTLKDDLEILEKNQQKTIANKPNNEIEDKPVFKIPLPKKKEEPRQLEVFENIVIDDKNEVCHSPLKTNKLPSIQENNQVTESEVDEDSQNGERLAIYSNDNHEEVDSYSLEESTELNTDEILNNLSDSLTKEEDNEKKKNLLVEIEGNDVKNNSELSDKISIEQLDDKKLNLPIKNIASLMKLKLTELQCLAEEKSISINLQNGKKKTKSELAKEISDLSTIPTGI